MNAPSQTRRFRFERRFQNLDLKLARQLDNQITTFKMARSRRQGKKPPGPNAADVTPKSPPQHKPPTPRPPTNLSPSRKQGPNTNTTPPTTGGRLRVKSRTDGNTTDVPTLKEPFTPGGSTRYEAVGGRVQASDGTWVAYALTRPVPRPGNPKSSLLVTVRSEYCGVPRIKATPSSRDPACCLHHSNATWQPMLYPTTVTCATDANPLRRGKKKTHMTMSV